jgi:hypothetical protein
MKERRIKRKKEKNEAEKIILENWCAAKREGKKQVRETKEKKYNREKKTENK